MPELKSEMRISDRPVDAVLSCAKCGRAVKSGAAHICGFYEAFSSSSGAEMFVKKEKVNANKD